MLFRNKLHVAAFVGLAVFFNPINQDCRAQTGAPNGQGQPKEETKPVDVTPIKDALDGIANTVKSLKDNPDADAEKTRAERDLTAQEDMARWAFWLFCATVASLILTAVGVVLIWRTLVHTRRAVDSSDEMVAEAKLATVAAVAATSEAKRQADLSEESFRRLERPYIVPGEIRSIERDDQLGGGSWYFVRYSIGNYGRTPAIIHYLNDSFGPGPLNHLSDPESGIRKIERDFNYGKVIPANTIDPAPHAAVVPGVVNVEFERGGYTLSIDGKKEVFLVINTKFEDMVGVIREGRFTWRYDPNRRRFLRYGGKEYNYERETPPT